MKNYAEIELDALFKVVPDSIIKPFKKEIISLVKKNFSSIRLSDESASYYRMKLLGK